MKRKTALEQVEETIVSLWNKRQSLVEDQEHERQAKSAHDAWLEEVRVNVPEWRDGQESVLQRYYEALGVILDLHAENQEYSTNLRRAEVPVGFQIPRTAVNFARRERDRIQVFLRGPRDRESANKQRADQLRAFAKEVEQSARGYARNKDVARQRAEDARAAADRLEGKTPKPKQEPDGMFITPEQALGRRM